MIGIAARELKKRRAEADVSEAELRYELDTFLRSNRGSAAGLAKTAGITVQHLSDIRHGRRSPGDAVIAKLAKIR
jgi:transcriptional regulator with XRE-family HTH domain